MNVRMERSGFTLIEILVAVAILGIISAAAVANYGVSVQRSRFDAVQSVLQSIYDGEQTFAASNPTSLYTAIDCTTVQDALPPAISWRRSLNMDRPCPTPCAPPTVCYAVAVGGGGATFTATATAPQGTRTIDNTRAPGGSWTRP